MSAKTKALLFKGLMFFGAAALLFSFMRAQAVSSSSGGKTTLVQALQNDLKAIFSK